MAMKKILASVLAAASVLSMSAVASATSATSATGDVDKAVSAAGATSYKVNVGQIKVTLDVVVPTAMEAFINPYGAEFKMDGKTTPTTSKSGVVSKDYVIINKTTDFGLTIDIVGGMAEGTGDAAVATKIPTTGKDIYVVMNSMPGKTTSATTLADTDKTVAAITAPLTTAAEDTANDTKATGKGVFVFTEDEKNLKSFAYAPAAPATAGTATGLGIAEIYFTGALGTPSDDDGDWTDKDGLKLTYALKINPGPKANAT